MASSDSDHSYNLPEDLEREVKSRGLCKSVLDKLKAEMEEWRQTKLNIAVVGQSRQGKSSLINTMCGLRWNSKEGAAVSARGETTGVLMSYVHPRNPNVFLWDCPGIDGSNFKRDEYFDKIDVKNRNYDFYLIVTGDIFSDNALYLAERIQKVYKKRFYLVRTKVDETVTEILVNECPGLSEENCVRQLKHNIATEMEKSKFFTDQFKIYMVSNKEPHKYEYDDLQHDICEESSSQLFREAYLFTISAKGRKINQLKYQMLKGRSLKKCLFSAVGALVPIPGLSAGIDINIYVQEAMTYTLTFGLDKESVAEREKNLQLPSGTLEKRLDKCVHSLNQVLHMVRNDAKIDYKLLFDSKKFGTTVTTFLTSFQPQLISLLGGFVASETAEKVLTFSIPIFGSLFAGATSAGVTAYQLRQLLNDAKEAADYMCEMKTN